jgi:hypothetical protein
MGRTFVKAFGVRTYEDYLVQNPENLKPGRRYAFYEKTEDGSYELAWTGTLNHPPQQPNSGQLPQHLGLSDAPQQTSSSQPTTIVVQQPQQGQGATRGQIDDIMEEMRSERERLHTEITRLQTTLTETQSKLIEAERGRIQAEAERTSATQRYESDIAALRAEHERELSRQKDYHEQSLNILTQEAVNKAMKAVREELDAERANTQLNDDGPSLADRLLTLAEPAMPMIIQLGTTLFERLLDGKGGAKPQPQQQPQQVMMAPPSVAPVDPIIPSVQDTLARIYPQQQ